MFAMFLLGAFLGTMYQETFKHDRCVNGKTQDIEYCKAMGGFKEHVKNDIVKE